VEKMPIKIIKRKIRHPKTFKLINRIYIKGKGYFSWNSIYHVYNSDKNYDQLNSRDLKKINYLKSR